METLKYDREKINLLKPYCKTIDSLTQGHCIKWRIKILELELELFLSRVFGFETTIKDDYPYGKFIDAFPFSDRIFSGFGLGMKEAIKAKFQNASIPRWQKRKLLKLLDKPKEFKKFLAEYPIDQLNNIGKEFPGFELTKDEFVDVSCGTPDVEKKVLQRLFDGAVKFENLILHYSKIDPGLKNIGKSFDKYADGIYKAITTQQEMQEKNHHLKINENVVFKNHYQGFMDSLENVIDKICNKHELNSGKAKEYLSKSEPSEIPSINAYITFVIEYQKRHKGTFSRGRKPKQSDLGDVVHAINLPYVDIYSTDKFFSEVVRKKAGNFGTRIVNSLSQLKVVLESNLR